MFIDKDKILSYLTEEEIFNIVFKFKEFPALGQNLLSPFRKKDKKPGCWFDIHKDKLYFVDFGNSKIIGSIKMSHLDCFSCVQVWFKLRTFYDTLKFLKNYIVKNKLNVIRKEQLKIRVPRNKLPIFITTVERSWEERDIKYWKQFGITVKQLISENVFPVKKFKMFNTKKGDFVVKTKNLAYCLSLDGTRKKIYQPTGKYKFTTNCSKNDVMGHYKKDQNEIDICGSFKDYRVLVNEGRNVCWLQSESIFPDKQTLLELYSTFEVLNITFDNDNAGIENSDKLKEILSILFPNKQINILLPPIFGWDYADWRKNSRISLKDFIKTLNCKIETPY